MPLLTRLLGIWAVGKTVSSTTPLFMRLLLGMAALTLAAVFVAVLMALLMAGAVWLTYQQLLAHGVPELNAALFIAAGLMALMLIGILTVRHYWRKAYCLSKKIIYLQSPISGRIHSWSDAFMNGFNSKV